MSMLSKSLSFCHSKWQIERRLHKDNSHLDLRSSPSLLPPCLQSHWKRIVKCMHRTHTGYHHRDLQDRDRVRYSHMPSTMSHSRDLLRTHNTSLKNCWSTQKMHANLHRLWLKAQMQNSSLVQLCDWNHEETTKRERETIGSDSERAGRPLLKTENF